MFIETKARSIAKAISNRAMNSLAGMLIVYYFTDGNKQVALAYLATDIVVKFLLFYINERIWNKLHYGKKELRPVTIWLTGLPFAGKRMIADELSSALAKRKITVERLDGDDIKTLFPQEGVSREERNEYLMRMGYFAKLLVKNGVFVVASFISPYEESRAYNRRLIKDYYEVYVATPQEECEKNDVWGNYEKARRGEIHNFVGVQEKYEPPASAELVVDLSKETAREATAKILKAIRHHYI